MAIFIPKEVREQVYIKYDNRCVKCGSKENLTIDHIKPLSEGGENIKPNMQLMCYDCNVLKGNKYKLPFFKHIKKIWTLHDYCQVWKTQIKSEARSLVGSFKKEIYKYVEDKSSIHQSQNDKRMNTAIAIISSLKEQVNEQNKKIDLLCKYLKVEYIPKQILEQEAHFDKIKKHGTNLYPTTRI